MVVWLRGGGGSAKRLRKRRQCEAFCNICVLKRGSQHQCSRARFATSVFSSAVRNIWVLERAKTQSGKKTDSISPSAVVKKLGTKRVQKNAPQKNGQHFPLRSGRNFCHETVLEGTAAKKRAAFPPTQYIDGRRWLTGPRGPRTAPTRAETSGSAGRNKQQRHDANETPRPTTDPQPAT
jgi:hypothetical protein